MNTNITTLENAELAIRRAGIVENETVEGRQLLEICGFSLNTPTKEIKRQIEKHGFVEGKDFRASMPESTGGRPKTVYHFTINAANHVLLAAMTKEGKAARQEAIDTKMGQAQSSVPAFRLPENMSESYDMIVALTGLAGEAIKKSEELKEEALSKTFNDKQLSPTDIGYKLGMKPKDVNDELCLAGLQERFSVNTGRVIGGKPEVVKGYRLTDSGQKYGCAATSSKAKVQSLRWTHDVLDILKERINRKSLEALKV